MEPHHSYLIYDLLIMFSLTYHTQPVLLTILLYHYTELQNAI